MAMWVSHTTGQTGVMFQHCDDIMPCGIFMLGFIGCDILLKAIFVIGLWNAPLFDAGEISPNQLCWREGATPTG